MVETKINLILHTVRRVDNRFDGRVHDFPAMHVDLDFVADFGVLIRHVARVIEYGYWEQLVR